MPGSLPPSSPRISVVIPTCRRTALLLDCIASILRNDYADFEILVVDQDPSQSLKATLAQRFGSKDWLVYLFLDVAALDRARNLGLERARGQIVVFVDDDVEVAPGWLRSYDEAFTRVQPTPGIVAGRLSPLWSGERPDWLPEEKEVLLGVYDLGGELRPMPPGDLPIGANFAVWRPAAAAAGRFDERLDYSYERRGLLSGGDSNFALRVRRHYPLYYQPAARVWHKILASKLTPRYILRRNFWDGYSLITVMHLSDPDTRDKAWTIIRWHAWVITAQLGRLFFPRGRAPRWPDLKLRVQALSQCANSLGVIWAMWRLRWTGHLP